MEQNLNDACVHIYAAMGLYEEAVDLALKVGGGGDGITGWVWSHCWRGDGVVSWRVGVVVGVVLCVSIIWRADRRGGFGTASG